MLPELPSRSERGAGASSQLNTRYRPHTKYSAALAATLANSKRAVEPRACLHAIAICAFFLFAPLHLEILIVSFRRYLDTSQDSKESHASGRDTAVGAHHRTIYIPLPVNRANLLIG